MVGSALNVGVTPVEVALSGCLDHPRHVGLADSRTTGLPVLTPRAFVDQSEQEGQGSSNVR
jgi:hypothetical protein